MARGTYTGFSLASFDTEPNENVKIWNTTTLQWETWDITLPTAQNNQFGARISVIPFHFAKELARRQGCVVKVLASASNGLPISYWDTGAEKWNEMVSQVERSGTAKVGLVLWHQGINDTTNPEYPAKFLNLVSRVRKQPWLAEIAPWIAGYVTDPHTQINKFYTALEGHEVYPLIRIANTKGRPTLVGDPNHYTNDSIANMGKVDYIDAFMDYISR